MTTTSITCRPTRDTFVRFGIVLLAFFGFGLYFFYDGAVGYRKANEVYFSYQAFARLGSKATEAGAETITIGSVICILMGDVLAIGREKKLRK